MGIEGIFLFLMFFSTPADMLSDLAIQGPELCLHLTGIVNTGSFSWTWSEIPMKASACLLEQNGANYLG